MFRPARERLRLPRIAAAATFCVALAVAAPAQSPASFAQRIAALSEPGGYFDTDNLISNEASYVRVVPELVRLGVRGGAYVGVGPDQNFTYIAAIRPSIAFIVDIRRDNMLLHLLFKALFELAGTRASYLALLFGQLPPREEAGWKTAPIERILSHLDAIQPSHADTQQVRAMVDAAIARFRVPLSADDLRTIDRFHRRFVHAGSSLQFQSTGRAPRSYYPTYRDLLVARDSSGGGSFLASEASFQFLKGLQRRDLIVPVVGDVSGPKALAAIGQLLTQRGERLSAFYISNVEFYLGTGLPRYLENLGRIPHHPNAVIIRSVFGPYAATVGSEYSSSHVRPLGELLKRAKAGTLQQYRDVLK